MKLVLTRSFFNRYVQPTVILERDECFVPTKESVKEEPIAEIMNPRGAKVKKVVKTILVVLGVVAFLALGYYCFRDFLAPNFHGYKIY